MKKIIKSLICKNFGHDIVNPKVISRSCTRFQCKRCGGDFAINFDVNGAILEWKDVK